MVEDADCDALSLGSFCEMIDVMDPELDDQEADNLLEQGNAMLDSMSAFSDTLNTSITKLDEFSERNSKSRGVNQSLHDEKTTLESMAAVAAFADALKASKAKFDEFLHRTTTSSSTCATRHVEPSTLKSMAAFASTLKESMTKFDSFMERNSKSLGEYPDGVIEPRFSAQVGKRGREQYQEPLKHRHSDFSPSSIRALCGEELMSQVMYRGYATTSAVDNQENWRSGFQKPSQQNETWDNPEPILGEVVGSKMRRLESQDSYFHSRISTSKEVSNSANWASPLKLLNDNQGTAGQMVMTSLAVSECGRKKEGWPIVTSGNHVGGLSTSMSSPQYLARSNTPKGTSQTPLYTSWTVPTSLEDMQHLASVGACIPPQGSSRAFESSASNATWSGVNHSCVTVSLDEMQHLASTGVTFPSQEAPNSMASGTRAVPQRASSEVPKPAFGHITLEEMQRLANTSASFPTSIPFCSQTLHTPTESGVPDASQNASLGYITPEEMQYLTNINGSGASLAESTSMGSETKNACSNASGQDTMPSLLNVTLEETQRLSSINLRDAPWPATNLHVKNIDEDGHSLSFQAFDNTPPQEDSDINMQRINIENFYSLHQTCSAEVSQLENAVCPHDIFVKMSSSPSGQLKFPSSLDANEMAQRLQNLMKRSSSTQKALQDWDEKNGLPRSHSVTMVKSSRSRKQLQKGEIIAKWDGTGMTLENRRRNQGLLIEQRVG